MTDELYKDLEISATGPAQDFFEFHGNLRVIASQDHPQHFPYFQIEFEEEKEIASILMENPPLDPKATKEKFWVMLSSDPKLKNELSLEEAKKISVFSTVVKGFAAQAFVIPFFVPLKARFLRIQSSSVSVCFVSVFVSIYLLLTKLFLFYSPNRSL